MLLDDSLHSFNHTFTSQGGSTSLRSIRAVSFYSPADHKTPPYRYDALDRYLNWIYLVAVFCLAVGLMKRIIDGRAPHAHAQEEDFMSYLLSEPTLKSFRP